MSGADSAREAEREAARRMAEAAKSGGPDLDAAISAWLAARERMTGEALAGGAS